MVELSDVVAAREVLDAAVHETPVFTSTRIGRDLGIRLHLKAELFQKTGSFKPRGASNRLHNTPADELSRGLVTISAGNHAQGLAWAAARIGAVATVVMPANAPASKVSATREYGAEVDLQPTIADALRRLDELQTQRGLTLIHPFDDPLIIAGQGTVGLEIVEQVPDVDVVVCPVGGGGLISGVALAVKSLLPNTRIFGVEPEGADVMSRSWKAGEPVHQGDPQTIADGLAAPMAGQLTYPMTRRWVDGMVTVTESELVEGMKSLLTNAKLYAEPAGAAALAALVSKKIPITPGQNVVAIVSGGNVDLSTMARLTT